MLGFGTSQVHPAYSSRGHAATRPRGRTLARVVPDSIGVPSEACPRRCGRSRTALGRLFERLVGDLGPALGPVSAAQQVLNDAVAKVGCSKFYLGSPPAPAVDLWGPCLLDEKSVTFYVVSTDSNEKNFLALLTNLGYSPKQIIKAPSLLAAVEDPTQVEQVRSALNGSLVG